MMVPMHARGMMVSCRLHIQESRSIAPMPAPMAMASKFGKKSSRSIGKRTLA